MKKKFTFLIAALMLLTMISRPTRLWGQSRTATILFEETFNSCTGTGGNDGTWSNISTGTDVSITGWSFVQGKQADRCVRFGTRDKKGSAQTPAITFSGDATLTFKAGAWSGDNTTLKLSVTDGTLKQGNATISSVTMVNGSWTEYTVQIIGVTTSTKIKFEGNGSSKSRFFLDEVKVTQEATDPSCIPDPTSLSFGDVQVGSYKDMTVEVTTENLTSGLTLSTNNAIYTIVSPSPATIASSATSTDVTVRCSPIALNGSNGKLIIAGDDFDDDIEVSLSVNGTCTPPETALAFPSYGPLTYNGSTPATQELTQTANTGNDGTITYAMKEGFNPGGAGSIVDGSTFSATGTGTFVITATQDLNGTTCGDVVDITIVVNGTAPTCTVAPDEWDFGKVLTGETVTKTFSVTTANLTGNLTVAIGEMANGFSVTPLTISQGASSTDVTVTFAPNAATSALTPVLTISGGGLAGAVEVLIGGQGDAGYTVTFNPYSGTCDPTSIRVIQGESIATLPTATADGATFYGWATSKVASTTSAPSIVSTPYAPAGDVTLHAVYKIAKEFDNSAACAGSYTIYAMVETGEKATANYYATGALNKKYSSTTTAAEAKSFTLEKVTGNDKWAIKDGTKYLSYDSGTDLKTQDGSYTWTVTQGIKGTWRITSGTEGRALLFQTGSQYKFGGYATSNIPSNSNYYDIEFGSASFTYNSESPVAKPAFSLAGGSYTGTQSVTISCTTQGATIYYTTDGSDPTNESSVYSSPISISSSQTLKAIAMKSGIANSPMAYANYDIVSLLETMDEIFERAGEIGGTAENVAVKFTNWVVSGVNGSLAYVTDNNGKGFKIYIYGHGFAVNDKLNGTVVGTPLKLDNGSAEFTGLTSTTEGLTVTHDGTITPVAKTISQLTSGVNTGAVVTISNLAYNGTNLVDGSSNTISPNTSLYTYGGTLASGHDYSSVTGVFVMSNTTKQIHPRSAEDIVEVEYNITLNDVPSGCTIGTDGDITTAKYGQTVTLTQSAGPGYKFISWSVNSGAVTVTNNQFTMPKGAVTVTATFAPTYAIAYSVTPANTGTVTAEPNPAIEGETVTLTIAPAEGKALKSISAYRTDAPSTPVTITDNTITMPAYGVTVAAEFATEYSVTYNVNGGTGDAVLVKYGEGATVNAAAVPGAWTAPTGKLFKNWKTVASGEGTEYEVGAQITDNIDDNIVLYAQWRDILYHVSFSVNGEIVSERNVAYNTVIGALPADPELAPLTFLGWSSTSATGATNVTASWKPTGNNEDVTVYAVFGSMSESNLTITTSTSGITNAYKDNTDFTIGSIDFTCNDICKQGSGTEYIQMKSTGYIYNDEGNSFGKITSIVVTYNTTPRSVIVKVGTSANPTSASALTGVKDSEDDNIYTFTPSSGTDYGYILIGASETIKMNSIVIYYEAAAPLTVNIIGEDTNMSTDIEATTCVVVKDGATLNFTGENNGNANNLIIEDGGQLVLGNEATVAATIKKSTTASSSTKTPANNLYAIASPVDDIAISSFAQGTKHNVYRYDEPNSYWNEYRSNASVAPYLYPFDVLEIGRGYLYRSNVEGIDFAGDVTGNEVTYNLSYDFRIEKYKGLNLVGNPFTHNITWSNLTLSNVETGGCYVLNEDPEDENHGKWQAVMSESVTVKPMQAFFVQATAGSASITFKNTAGGGGKALNYANDNIMLSVKNGKCSDEAYVLFKEGHGLNKIEHRNAEIPMLYVMDNGQNFAIADMSDDTRAINLGFEAKTIGQYTFSIKTEGQYSYMHLVDKLTGEDVDMLVEDSYTFVGAPNDRKDRFVLNLNYNAANINTDSDIFAYQSGSDIIIRGDGELHVFDVMGRLVLTQRVNGVETISMQSQGVYIFKLNGMTQKIVVR